MIKLIYVLFSMKNLIKILSLLLCSSFLFSYNSYYRIFVLVILLVSLLWLTKSILQIKSTLLTSSQQHSFIAAVDAASATELPVVRVYIY